MSGKVLLEKLKDISTYLDSIRLDWDALRKDLKTNLLTDPETAHISRDWAQFVFKKEFGQNVTGSAVTTEAGAESPTGSDDRKRDSVAKLRIQLGTKIRSSVSREGTQQGEVTASGGKKKTPTCAEEIAQIVETWIAATQDPADIANQFRPLDPGKNLLALLAANATHSNPAVASLCSLPRSLVKEKTNIYKLPKTAIMQLEWVETPVDTGLTPSVPVPNKLDLDISSLNESLEKYGHSHKASLEKDLADAWDPVRQVLRGLLQVEREQKRILTVELAKHVNEYSRKHAIALRSFDEFWNSKTEKWKKKGGKKNGVANGVDEGALAEEADALFEQYIDQIKMVADAYAEEVQPILSELRRAMETYELLLSDLLKSSDLDPKECERARQAISGLGRRREEQIDEFLRNESKSRASLTCALSDLKDSYLEGSMRTLWGRLEKCSNRDFRKRIANVEVDQQKERDTLSTVLVSDVAPFSSVAVVCLVVLEGLIVKGERCEAEALLKSKASIDSDLKLKELAMTRKTLEGYYENGVFTGQIELGRKIGRVLWSAMKQSIQAAAESHMVAFISKSGGGSLAYSAASAESGMNAVDGDTKKKKKKKKKAKTGTGEAGAANVDSVTPPIEEPSGSLVTTVPDTPKEDEGHPPEQVAFPINGTATKEEESVRPDTPVKGNSAKQVSPTPKETIKVQEDKEVDLDLSQTLPAIGDGIVSVGGLTGARPSGPSGPPGFTGPGMWGGNHVFPFPAPAFPMSHPLGGISSPTSQELVSIRDENTSLRNENTQLRKERAALEEQLRAAQHTISQLMQRMRGLESQESVKRPGYSWNRRATVNCGNCGERGHESTACDAGCRYCLSKEHLSDVCPLPVM
ncbi:hypothetical protein SpCBS45565_g08106 [Spizellomyces sp. 'palustris']|nr:hypothetical protein SpCBS45565_g08106 [Spizellomyces sp. 'palustris']